jgi:transposase
MVNIEKVFCEVDDFCQKFIPVWKQSLIESGEKQRLKPGRLTESEVITLLVLFHHYRFRDFKTFYTHYAHKHLRQAFPELVSYTRMLTLLQIVMVPLSAFLISRYAKPTGIAFIDSSKIAVCHNIRIPRNKVFADIAQRGKGSMGWFYGFKLHLLVNDLGEILSVKVTAGNIDDRKPVPEMVKHLWGSLYADKGYLSKSLTESLASKDIQLITSARKNMKAKVLSLWDKLMLRKRYIIETIFDQLKNISQIEHTRHRSPVSFAVHLMAGLIAYTFQPKKPKINISRHEEQLLMQI